MQIHTKTQIAKATLTLLTAVAALCLLGVLVLVLCLGLGLNPFRETTSEFLGSAFVGLIGVAAILVLLNGATNLSLIADAKVAEMHLQPQRSELKKWSLIFIGTALALVALVFAGTYVSKQKYLALVHGQANEVIAANKSLLDDVSTLLAAGQYDDYKRIGDIRNFLATQRSGLPGLTLIYSGTFNGKLALYRLQDYFPTDPQYKIYTPTYYSCTNGLDCEYLYAFFSGSDVGALEKYTFRDNQFYIYIPFAGGKRRFVLLFNRMNSYGKLGS